MRIHAAALACSLLVASGASALEPKQLPPKHIYSIGDSITRAFDAYLPADNLNLSWVNGRRSALADLFGLPDVDSHQQRIRANFGAAGIRNRTAAKNGASVEQFVEQARGVRGDDTYVTVLLGGNDVCRDSVLDLPTDQEFAVDFANGLVETLERLPAGATVQVMAIPDVKRLYEIGLDKKALGVVDCSLVWLTTELGFPCGSMLSPRNTAADRAYVRQRNVGYNAIMQFLTALGALAYPDLFVSFSDLTFTYPFTQKHVSDIDCYHPSARGQRLLAEGTWEEGFFRDHEKLD
ncbi:MAG: SGNH/GDSL hydrolase family protein [Deltaproteobacteria bacterium]|nr:SGNH/GDSL hydrolase family protein [Deltaproteobacteria bacterium]